MKLWWYLARAGGLMSWALLALSTLWGFVLATRLFRTRPRPAWTLDLHRFLGALAVVFTAVHAGALVADGAIHFGPAEIFVPLASRWHPVAVAWGVVALYLLVAIEGTSLMMKRMSNAAWKRIHRTAFVLYVFATIHGLAAGTDARGSAWRWIMVGVTAVIMFLWVLRMFSGKARRTVPIPAASPAPGGRPGTAGAFDPRGEGPPGGRYVSTDA